jgi:DNA-binding NarL/FixJ family response regulator
MTNYPQNIIEKLSKREIEISILISEGYATKSIALKLGIKSNTVSTIKRNIFFKLGINSTIDLYKAMKEDNLLVEKT